MVRTPWSDCRHVIEFRHQTRATLVRLGIPPSVLKNVKRSTEMRNKAETYARQKFSQEQLPEFHEKLGRFLRDYELDSAVKSTVFSDTIEVLEQLRAQGTRMAIVTNTSTEAAVTILQRHDLKTYFDLIVTREDVERLKPNPEGIILAVRRLGATKFFMIGDSALDAKAAKSAAVTSIIVIRERDNTEIDLNGLSAIDAMEARAYDEERKKVRADYVVDSLVGIVPLIVAEQQRKLNVR